MHDKFAVGLHSAGLCQKCCEVTKRKTSKKTLRNSWDVLGAIEALKALAPRARVASAHWLRIPVIRGSGPFAKRSFSYFSHFSWLWLLWVRPLEADRSQCLLHLLQEQGRSRGRRGGHPALALLGEQLAALCASLGALQLKSCKTPKCLCLCLSLSVCVCVCVCLCLCLCLCL